MNELTRTVKSGLVELLREAIVCGDYMPGERLRLDDIAAQYEVSTMPVREALRDLETEGLVDLFPHRGAIVTKLSPDELADIYDIRAFLEEKATLAAVPKLTDEVLNKMASLIEDMDKNMDDVCKEVALNHEFHFTLYEASGRKHLYELNHLLRFKAQHYLRAFIQDLGGMPQAQVEHRAILAACKKGDAEKAASLMYHHVAKVGVAIVNYIQDQETKTADLKKEGNK